MTAEFWIGVIGMAVILIVGLLVCLAYRNITTPKDFHKNPPSTPARPSYGSPLVEPDPVKYREYLRSYDPPINESFPKILQERELVIQKYKEFIPGAEFETLDLNDHERVLFINKTFLVYFGILLNCEGDFEKTRDKIEAANKNGGLGYASYFLKIEELTYNDVFKFDIQKLRGYFIHKFFYIGFTPFWGVKEWQDNRTYELVFKRLNKEYPELRLQERFDLWSGVRCHFIIFKIENQGVSAYCVKHTSAKDPKASARRFKKQIVEGTVANIFDANNFLKLRKDIAARSEAELNDAISFYLIEKMIKNSDDLEKLRGMLQQSLNTNEAESTEEALKRCQSILDSF